MGGGASLAGEEYLADVHFTGDAGLLRTNDLAERMSAPRFPTKQVSQRSMGAPMSI